MPLTVVPPIGLAVHIAVNATPTTHPVASPKGQRQNHHHDQHNNESAGNGHEATARGGCARFPSSKPSEIAQIIIPPSIRQSSTLGPPWLLGR